jgi:hypothetical protein
MAPLLDYTARLRAQRPGWYVPDFDPAGGGIKSRVLFLFEKPGPNRAISREQRILAGQVIAELIGLLPALRAIVLVGRTAQAASDRAGLQAPRGVRIWRSLSSWTTGARALSRTLDADTGVLANVQRSPSERPGAQLECPDLLVLVQNLPEIRHWERHECSDIMKSGRSYQTPAWSRSSS